MKRLALIASALSAVLGGCGGASARYTLHGTFKLTTAELETAQEFDAKAGEPCWAKSDSGYNDISEGTQVVVKNEKGTIIGYGSLGPGITPQEYPSITCVFSFTVKHLRSAQIYGVEVSDRGEEHYSIDALAHRHWTVHLELG